MLRVPISINGQRGIVEYTPETKELRVDHPDDDVKRKVTRYLRKERDFWIPESNRIDDYRVDKAKPIDGQTYMDLGLSSMWSETGVWVHWEEAEED